MKWWCDKSSMKFTWTFREILKKFWKSWWGA